MEKIAFRMTLKPGHLDDYRDRHETIWPELVTVLKDAGIRDYSIHYDPATNALFATLWRESADHMDRLACHPVMQRWWTSMAPLMETHPDGSPVTVPLETLFHLD